MDLAVLSYPLQHPKQTGLSIHNHGDPGPGIYLPESWSNNRARFSERGFTLDDLGLVSHLEQLPAQGLYRVREDFACCPQQCRRFAPGQLVQLGYNSGAKSILFLPHWGKSGLEFPTAGTVIDASNLQYLERLTLEDGSKKGPNPTIH